MHNICYEVQKYGTIVNDYEICIESSCVKQKIYKYRDKLYIDIWCNGIRILCHELSG